MKIKKRMLIFAFIISFFLSLNFIFAIESSTEVQFYNSFDYPYCYTPSSVLSYWVYEGDWERSMSDCRRTDGFSTTDCCPIGYSICDENGICINNNKLHCGDFTDKTSCEDANGHPIIAANDLDTDKILKEKGLTCNTWNEIYGDKCYNYIACGCQWNETKGCQAVSEHQIYVPADDSFYNASSVPINIKNTCNAETSPDLGQCSFDFNIIDNCDTIGFLIRTWTAESQGTTGDYCKDGNDRIPCLDVVKLPFFTLINIIIAVGIIIGVYWFIIKKKK